MAELPFNLKAKIFRSPMPFADLQPVLAADKGEDTAHFTEKVFHLCHKGRFEFTLAVLTAKLQEVEGVFVPDRKLCLSLVFAGDGLVEVCLAKERFFVGPILNMMDENVLAPSILAGHADVEFPFEVIFAALKDQNIVSPANFSHHWCEFCAV